MTGRAAVLLLVLAGCPGDDDDEDFAHLGRAWPESDRGITPTSLPGNFVASSDEQVCYELDRVLGALFTEELRGFKIDPPASITTDAIAIAVEQPSLAFVTSAGYRIVGVIVKGADAYNVYDYRDVVIGDDAHLHAPYKHDKLPAISHYNVCYTREPPATGDQGCTPGYWRNHTDRWLGAAPADDFDAVFRTNAFDPNLSLGQVIALEAGGTAALARHATAALLNAHGGVPNADDGGSVAYPLSPARVVSLVRSALTSGDPSTIESTKDLLDAYNNLGCPLHGTPST